MRATTSAAACGTRLGSIASRASSASPFPSSSFSSPPSLVPFGSFGIPKVHRSFSSLRKPGFSLFPLGSVQLSSLHPTFLFGKEHCAHQIDVLAHGGNESICAEYCRKSKVSGRFRAVSSDRSCRPEGTSVDPTTKARGGAFWESWRARFRCVCLTRFAFSISRSPFL